MCGIFAVSRAAGRSSIPNLRQFGIRMLLGIEERGKDATGLGWTDQTGDPWFWKEKGKASAVSHHAPLPFGVQELIGHTRFATQGKPERNVNNHPIMAPGLVLVHNGIITNDDELFRLLNVPRQGEVDSEAVAQLLAWGEVQLGQVHPTDLLELVEGDAALAWLDARTPHTLHLAVTVSRPMVLAYTRRGDLVMASTHHAINETAKELDIEMFDFRDVQPGTYMKVEQGKIVDERTFRPNAARRSYRHFAGGTSYEYGGWHGGSATTYEPGKYVNGKFVPDAKKAANTPATTTGSVTTLPAPAAQGELWGGMPKRVWSTRDQAWIPIDEPEL